MTNSADQNELNLNWQKISIYLIELRRRLLSCLMVFGGLFALSLYFVDPIYHLLLLPFNHTSTHPLLLATTMSAVWLVPFKISFLVALLLGIPFYLYQLWQFVFPALYSIERKQFWRLLILSCGLFYIGMSVAYFMVLPLLYQLMLHMAPSAVKVMPELSNYVTTTLQVMWSFGLMFQLPILILIAIKFNWVSYIKLKELRPYVIVGAFIVGMFLAPPDVISQTLFALPLWALFETGIILSRIR